MNLIVSLLAGCGSEIEDFIEWTNVKCELVGGGGQEMRMEFA